jgi:hypothetical protein
MSLAAHVFFYSMEGWTECGYELPVPLSARHDAFFLDVPGLIAVTYIVMVFRILLVR